MNKISGRIIFFIILLVITGVVCVSCGKEQSDTISLNGAAETENTLTVAESTEKSDSAGESATGVNGVYVYVTGQVKNPGVYQVNENARLYEVIDLAGGFTKKAAENALNLAEKVCDGQHIVVMSKSEYNEMGQNDAQTTHNKEVSGSDETAEADLVNINTATKEELMTLPGIGESKAVAIVNYREENGAFSSIQDIMQVSGIKEAAFSQIKDLITT